MRLTHSQDLSVNSDGQLFDVPSGLHLPWDSINWSKWLEDLSASLVEKSDFLKFFSRSHGLLAKHLNFTDDFYATVLPQFVQLLRSAPEHFPGKPWLLPRRFRCKVVLSSTQAFLILIGSIFFPVGSHGHSLFFILTNPSTTCKLKTKCLEVYFRYQLDIFHDSAKKYSLEYSRVGTNRVFHEDPIIGAQDFLPDLATGYIEDAPSAVTKAIFCNLHIGLTFSTYAQSKNKKMMFTFFLGGGVFRFGLAQEELVLIQFPELLLSTFLADDLLSHEVLCVTGCRRYSKVIKNLGVSLRLAVRELVIDIDVPHQFVFMDASNRRQDPEVPFQTSFRRDLHKVCVAFASCATSSLATGFWGAGCFGHDSELSVS